MVSLLYIITPGASMIRRPNGSKLRNGPQNERWSILLTPCAAKTLWNVTDFLDQIPQP